MIERVFLRHPRGLGESYGQHAAVAGRFGFAMLGAGAACLAHAIIPSLFTHAGSDTVKRLHARLSARRSTPVASPPTADWQLTFEI